MGVFAPPNRGDESRPLDVRRQQPRRFETSRVGVPHVQKTHPSEPRSPAEVGAGTAQRGRHKKAHALGRETTQGP